MQGNTSSTCIHRGEHINTLWLDQRVLCSYAFSPLSRRKLLFHISTIIFTTIFVCLCLCLCHHLCLYHAWLHLFLRLIKCWVKNEFSWLGFYLSYFAWDQNRNMLHPKPLAKMLDSANIIADLSNLFCLFFSQPPLKFLCTHFYIRCPLSVIRMSHILKPKGWLPTAAVLWS